MSQLTCDERVFDMGIPVTVDTLVAHMRSCALKGGPVEHEAAEVEERTPEDLLAATAQPRPSHGAAAGSAVVSVLALMTEQLHEVQASVALLDQWVRDEAEYHAELGVQSDVRLGQLAAAVDETDARVTLLANRLEGLEQHVAAEFDALRRSMDAHFAALEARLPAGTRYGAEPRLRMAAPAAESAYEEPGLYLAPDHDQDASPARTVARELPAARPPRRSWSRRAIAACTATSRFSGALPSQVTTPPRDGRES